MEILWVLLAIGSIVFWMHVAWRAMLAHERLDITKAALNEGPQSSMRGDEIPIRVETQSLDRSRINIS
jgi:hypothetical protein